MEKWLAVMLIGVFGAMFGALAYSSKMESECKIAYAQSGKTTDEIVKICHFR